MNFLGFEMQKITNQKIRLLRLFLLENAGRNHFPDKNKT